MRMNSPTLGKYTILTSPLEGGGEKALQTGVAAIEPHNFAWSPNDDKIYYSHLAEPGFGAIRLSRCRDRQIGSLRYL